MPNEPQTDGPLSHQTQEDLHGNLHKHVDPMGSPHDAQPRWYDDPDKVNRLFYLLIGISVVLLLIDPLISKHGSLAVERFWGFYGLFGLIAGGVLVLLAGLFRRIVMRPEDYYDR